VIRNRTWINIVLILLVIFAILGLTWINYQYSVENPGGNDFLARWMGARMWLMEGISPYDNRVSEATQIMIYGHMADPEQGEDINHFVYPLHSMIFFAPFGLLDYDLARAIWMTILEICLILLVFTSLRVTDWKVSLLMTAILIVFFMTWYHGVRTIILGQFAGINALLIPLALLLISLKQDIPAGILLAITTSKPQMSFLLIPFVLIWGLSVRRNGLILGIIGGLVGSLVVTLALIPDWPLQMFRQVLEYPSYTSYTNIDSPLSYISDFMPGIRVTLNGVLHVVLALYLFIEWRLAWKKDFRWFLWTSGMTLVVSNLVAYRTATTNYLVLVPVLFLIFRVWEQRWGIFGRGAIWFSLLSLFVGLWFLFLTTIQGNQEHPVMFLPLPFFCLIGLWWVRWWAVRPSKLLLEDFAARMG
jgi:hypothetical protein